MFYVLYLYRVKSALWSLKWILQNSMGDLCSCWEIDDNIRYRILNGKQIPIILSCLSLKQNITIFPLCTTTTDASLHRLLCIGHVYDSHFVQVRLLLNTLLIFLCLLISICGAGKNPWWLSHTYRWHFMVYTLLPKGKVMVIILHWSDAILDLINQY